MSNKAVPSFQQLCPMLWNAIHGRRYLLPQYRQGDYENQEILNDMFQRSLIAAATGKKDDEVQFDNLVSALRHDRPIRFLERELGEAFARTQLPADMNTTDVRWKWPQLRIMMPLGLCTIVRNGASRSLSFLDICRIEKGMDLPEKHQSELESYLKRVLPASYANPARRTINQICYRAAQPVLCLAGATDYNQAVPQRINFGWLTAWTQDNLSRLFNTQDAMLPAERKYDEVDEAFLRRIRHFAFNILLFLSATPLEYTPTPLCKPRREGKHHLKPALLRAPFVGASQIRPVSEHRIRTEPTGQERASHWTSGHWRRTSYGPKHSLKRLEWVLPYATGELREQLTTSAGS